MFNPFPGMDPYLEKPDLWSDVHNSLITALRNHMADLLPFNVQNQIPSFTLPLLIGDEEPEIGLGRLLQDLYEQAGYDLRINYNRQADPPLSAADKVWAETILKKPGIRF